MVIYNAEGIGESQFRDGAELGEWGGRIGCVNTRSGLRQFLFFTRTGRSPAVTIAWARPLCASTDAVQFATTLAGG